MSINLPIKFTLTSLVSFSEIHMKKFAHNQFIVFSRYYTWEEIKAIDVGSISASRSFIFLWCGSADGLDKGRECLKKWGFRRCEDICWIKTNKRCKTPKRVVHSTGIFQRTKVTKL